MTLNELGNIDIDIWVETISKLDDDPVVFKAVIEEATDEEIRNWLEMDRCPGELERAFDVVCARMNIQFDDIGNRL